MTSLPVSQEPGTPEQIKAYTAAYGVEFDVFAKIEVNGSHAHPLYKFLKSRVRGGLGNFIKWNYEKVRRLYNVMYMYMCTMSCTCTYVQCHVYAHMYMCTMSCICTVSGT